MRYLPGVGSELHFDNYSLENGEQIMYNWKSSGIIFLNEEFDGFIHDIPLWTGNCDCSHRRRIDFRKMIGNAAASICRRQFRVDEAPSILFDRRTRPSCSTYSL